MRVAHNVFFKLTDNAPNHVDALVSACHQYLNVQPGIVFFAAGKLCAELKRAVNDLNWDVGLHLDRMNPRPKRSPSFRYASAKYWRV